MLKRKRVIALVASVMIFGGSASDGINQLKVYAEENKPGQTEEIISTDQTQDQSLISIEGVNVTPNDKGIYYTNLDTLEFKVNTSSNISVDKIEISGQSDETFKAITSPDNNKITFTVTKENTNHITTITFKDSSGTVLASKNITFHQDTEAPKNIRVVDNDENISYNDKVKNEIYIKHGAPNHKLQFEADDAKIKEYEYKIEKDGVIEEEGKISLDGKIDLNFNNSEIESETKEITVTAIDSFDKRSESKTYTVINLNKEDITIVGNVTPVNDVYYTNSNTLDFYLNASSQDIDLGEIYVSGQSEETFTCDKTSEDGKIKLTFKNIKNNVSHKSNITFKNSDGIILAPPKDIIFHRDTISPTSTDLSVVGLASNENLKFDNTEKVLYLNGSISDFKLEFDTSDADNIDITGSGFTHEIVSSTNGKYIIKITPNQNSQNIKNTATITLSDLAGNQTIKTFDFYKDTPPQVKNLSAIELDANKTNIRDKVLYLNKSVSNFKLELDTDDTNKIDITGTGFTHKIVSSNNGKYAIEITPKQDYENIKNTITVTLSDIYGNTTPTTFDFYKDTEMPQVKIDSPTTVSQSGDIHYIQKDTDAIELILTLTDVANFEEFIENKNNLISKDGDFEYDINKIPNTNNQYALLIKNIKNMNILNTISFTGIKDENKNEIQFSYTFCKDTKLPKNINLINNDKINHKKEISYIDEATGQSSVRYGLYLQNNTHSIDLAFDAEDDKETTDNNLKKIKHYIIQEDDNAPVTYDGKITIPFNSSIKEEIKIIKVTAVDFSNNESETKVYELHKDDISPTNITVTPKDFISYHDKTTNKLYVERNSNKAILNFSATDNSDMIKHYKINYGEGIKTSTDGTIEIPFDNTDTLATKTVTVIAVDHSSNESEPETYSVIRNNEDLTVDKANLSFYDATIDGWKNLSELVSTYLLSLSETFQFKYSEWFTLHKVTKQTDTDEPVSIQELNIIDGISTDSILKDDYNYFYEYYIKAKNSNLTNTIFYYDSKPLDISLESVEDGGIYSSAKKELKFGINIEDTGVKEVDTITAIISREGAYTNSISLDKSHFQWDENLKSYRLSSDSIKDYKLEDGKYTIDISVTSNFSNKTINNKKFTFYIDSKAPEIDLKDNLFADIPKQLSVNTSKSNPGVINVYDKIHDTIDKATLDTVTLNITHNGKEVLNKTKLASELNFDLPLSMQSEGIYKIEVTAVDTAGNTAEPVTNYITIDTSKPVVDIKVSSLGVDTNSNNDVNKKHKNDFNSGALNVGHKKVDKVTPVITIKDVTTTPEDLSFVLNGKSIEYDTKPLVSGYGMEVTFKEPIYIENIYDLSISVGDKATRKDISNKSYIISNISDRTKFTSNLNFAIDRSAPDIKSVKAGNKTISKGSKIYLNSKDSKTITAEIEDKLSELKDLNIQTIIKPSNGSSSTSRDSYTFNSDDSYSVVITAIDKAGNDSTFDFDVIVDTGIPKITIEGIKDGHYSNKEIKPSISIDDDTAKLTMTLNGKPYTTDTVIEKEGKYNLVVKAEDDAGNIQEIIISFVVDKTKPVITITGIKNNQTYTEGKIKPLIKWDDPEALLTILLNNLDYSGEIIDKDGAYILYVKATDKAGNISEEQFRFKVNLSKPEIEVLTIENNKKYNSPVTLDIKFIDAVKYTILVNGKEYKVGDTIVEPGSYTLTIIAEDEDGNKSEETRTFTIDTAVDAVAFKNEEKSVETASNYKTKAIAAVSTVSAALIGAFAWFVRKK